MNEFIQTPEHYFHNIDNYPYTPNYINDIPETGGGRLHYVDVGQDINGVALCLHGNNTWGYCYRKMIQPLVEHGYRVIVPDMIGFGRSDKPVYQSWHSYQQHRSIMMSFIQKLNLQNIMLVCHDWGGIIGLTIPPDMPDRFNKLVITNTMLYTGDRMCNDWYNWLQRSNKEDIDIPKFIQQRSIVSINEDLSAYAAPFPTSMYRAATRAFPNFIPDVDHVPGFDVGTRAIDFYKNTWNGQCFVAIGSKDHVMASTTLALAHTIKNCMNPMIIEEAGHFINEWGDQIIKKALLSFI